MRFQTNCLLYPSHLTVQKATPCPKYQQPISFHLGTCLPLNLPRWLRPNSPQDLQQPGGQYLL